MSNSTSTTNSNSSQAYGIPGKHAVNLTFGGTTLPINPKDSEFCVIETQNVSQVLPTIMVSLLDFYNINSTPTPINDGTKFSIAFNDGNTGLPPASNYRVFGSPKRIHHPSGYDELKVIGILDNLTYFRETANRALTGASTTVVGQIANLLNMKYSTNDSSNDSMAWLSGRGTWAKYVANISKYAYTNDKSSFSHAVSNDNTLHFINLQKLFATTTYSAVFYRGASPTNMSEPAYEILDYSVEHNSGFLNHFYGYGLRQGQTSGAGIATISTTVNASTVNGTNLDINKNDAQRLSNRTRMQIAPVDGGNSHSLYVVAKHQNARIKATYSQCLYILVPLYTNLKLYDMVRVKIYNNGAPNLTLSGTYTVSGISRCIYGLNFVEKLQLSSNGPGNINPSLY